MDGCDQSKSAMLATRSTNIQSKYLVLLFSVTSVFSVANFLTLRVSRSRR